jgi:hypothetical protein
MKDFAVTLDEAPHKSDIGVEGPAVLPGPQE